MEISPVRMPATNALDKIASAATKKTGTAADEGGSSFAALIEQSLSQVNASQTAADTATHDWQLGRNGVSIEDAMVSVQKANISFSTAVQVRNKLVSAYNDIMNMQL